MSLEIETTVAALIASCGVTYQSIYMGVKKNALGGNTEMDRWVVGFSIVGSVAEEFEFFTGMGCRTTVRGMKAMNMKGVVFTKGHWEATKPVAPSAASVLSSLLVDSEASYISFRNWCDEFGYDDDSISARNTYDACQENADKLKKIFNNQQIEQLREALADY